jgi:hypothetical protein
MVMSVSWPSLLKITGRRSHVDFSASSKLPWHQHMEAPYVFENLLALMIWHLYWRRQRDIDSRTLHLVSFLKTLYLRNFYLKYKEYHAMSSSSSLPLLKVQVSSCDIRLVWLFNNPSHECMESLGAFKQRTSERTITSLAPAERYKYPLS